MTDATESLAASVVPDTRPKIVIPANSAKPATMALLPAVVMVIGAIGTIAGFVAKRDLAGFIIWIQGETAAQVGAAAILVVGTAYGWWRSYRSNEVKKVLDEHTPAEISEQK